MIHDAHHSRSARDEWCGGQDVMSQTHPLSYDGEMNNVGNKGVMMKIEK